MRAFINDFEMIVSELGWNDDACMYLFQDKLPDYISWKINNGTFDR